MRARKVLLAVPAGALALSLGFPATGQAGPAPATSEPASASFPPSPGTSMQERAKPQLSPRSSVEAAENFWQDATKKNKPWQGGDATYTIPLPDGRVMWMWGDSIVGEQRSNGSLAPGWKMVRNSVAVGRPAGDRWSFTHGMLKEFFPNVKKDKFWYWPLYGAAGDPVTVRGERGFWVWVFAQEVVRDIRRGSTGFSFMGSGNAIFRVWVPWGGMPKMWSKRMVPFPEAGTETGILWGAGAERVGDTMYMYGTRRVHEDLVFGRELFVAKTPFGSTGDTDKWTFWDGSDWVSDVDKAAVIHPPVGGVSTTLSADYINGKWILVTKKDEFLGSDVIALTATEPYGPFTETVLFQSPYNDTLYTYQPSAHPELASPPGTMMVTINQNPADFTEVARKPHLYRPLFKAVAIP